MATAELCSQAASQAGSQEKSQSQLPGLAFFSKLYEMKTNQIKGVIFQTTFNVNIRDIISTIFLTGAEIKGESGAGLQQLTLTCQTTSHFDTSDRSDQAFLDQTIEIQTVTASVIKLVHNFLINNVSSLMYFIYPC